MSATARGLAMQPLNQPIEMIDRERQTGQGDQWAKRIARLTGDDWQGHVLVPRRLRVAPCAAEPEAQTQGRRAGLTRDVARCLVDRFVTGSVIGVDGGVRGG